MKDIININKYNCSIINFTSISDKSVKDSLILISDYNIDIDIVGITGFYYHSLILNILSLIQTHKNAGNILIYVDTKHDDSRIPGYKDVISLFLKSFTLRSFNYRGTIDVIIDKINNMDEKVVGRMETTLIKNKTPTTKLKKFRKFLMSHGLAAVERIISNEKTSVMFLCK